MRISSRLATLAFFVALEPWAVTPAVGRRLSRCPRRSPRRDPARTNRRRLGRVHRQSDGDRKRQHHGPSRWLSFRYPLQAWPIRAQGRHTLCDRSPVLSDRPRKRESDVGAGRSSVKRLSKDHARMSRLVSSGAGTSEDFDKVDGDLAEAKATELANREMVQQATLNLSFTEVRRPSMAASAGNSSLSAISCRDPLRHRPRCSPISCPWTRCTYSKPPSAMCSAIGARSRRQGGSRRSDRRRSRSLRRSRLSA